MPDNQNSQPPDTGGQSQNLKWEESLPQKGIQNSQDVKLETNKLNQPEVEAKMQPDLVVNSQPTQSSISVAGKLSQFQKPLKLGLFIIFSLLFLAAAVLGTIYVRKNFLSEKIENEEKPISTATDSAQATSIPTTQIVNLSGARAINWFVVTPPSTIPSNQTANWSTLDKTSFKIKFPKEWTTKTTDYKPTQNVRLVNATLLGPKDQSGPDPVTVTQLETDLDLNNLVTNTISNQQVSKSTIAVAGVSGIKTSGEVTANGYKQSRIFLPIFARNYLQIIFIDQTADDEVIFNLILSSLTIS